MPRRLSAGLAVLALGLFTVGLINDWIDRTKLPGLSLATSVTVSDRHGGLLRAYTVADGRWRLPADVASVDPRYIAFLIGYEDRRFREHAGVDPRALLRAAGQAVQNGGVVSGGSTLTMQVARLLEESGTGRWRGKWRQIRLALALERRLSKPEILNLYLKLAPFGGNLEGVRAASLAWFGKEPDRLTPAQAALLVALPQSPETRRPDRDPLAARAARDRVLLRLAEAGLLPEDEAQAAMAERIPNARRPFPALAAHLADRARQGDPIAPAHKLTLDGRLQALLEPLATAHVAHLPPGLSAGIVVAELVSGDVLASVGSAGYLDTSRAGFVDMTRAIRSPGSTLKPLIYGMAFEAGLAHPETLIEDRPTAFGAYAPENFDKVWHGTLPVREALQYSLNLPAVALLEAIGPARFLARMRRAGIDARLPGKDAPGLAIGLGGIGLSLEDLVRLYAGIARGGASVDLNWRQGAEGSVMEHALLSAGAAWQVADILTGVKGPVLAPRIGLAYKTGTSYGYRDAWAIGFDGAHVIGVWVGRPDGASVSGLTGWEVAAPLLFQAFRRLKPELDPLPAPPPATLILANADLPPRLQHFLAPGQLLGLEATGPKIAFPPDGAVLDLGLGRAGALPLVVKLQGGVPPFTLIADGRPVLQNAHERQLQWVPDGPGFLSLSVIDATGATKSADLELR